MEIKEPYRPGYCPNCGAKFGDNRTDVYRYGSPIRTCAKCKGQYLNKCYHEAAIDGFSDADTSLDSSKKNIRNALMMILIMAAVNVLFYVMERHTWIYLLFLALGGVYLLVSLKDYIQIKNGNRETVLQKAMEESVQRLKDPDYARQLQELGYDVPEEYLPEETE